MKKIDQKGFSALDIILSIVLVAVIGVAGYSAYQARVPTKNSTASPTPNASLATSTTTPSPDPTLNWKTYTSAAGKYSIKYPSAWVTSECGDERTTALSIAPSSKYLSACNNDGGEIWVISRPVGSEYNTSTDGGAKVTITSGLTGATLRSTNGSFMSPDYKIAVAKTYVFKTSGHIYELSYMQDTNRGFPDNEAEFNIMVEKTFKAN